MEIMQIVFSPTGGTGKVSDILAKALGTTTMNIDLAEVDADFSSIQADGKALALFALPVYGGRIPALAAERLKKIKGNGTKCVIVAVYGNRAYDDALVELQNLVEQAEFTVIAAVSAVAEHSIVRQYAAGRPDEKDEAELQGFAADILKKYQESVNPTPLSLPGSMPIEPAGGLSLIPKVNSKCNSCGLCAEKCPAQAISSNNFKSTDGKKCISCMRCVSICPQSARKVSSVMVSAAALAIKKACSVRKGNELFV